ncbi:hypothetical protein SLS62_001859 [Diatrype stigma]|uniref:Uncharacterized protein n=1 Tax=Diatrype stigma TaxID=117547 RepID=A0AAN9V9Z3_9PEZI
MSKPDYAVMERGYWQQTTVARAREDAKMDADYRARRDKYRGHLVDLYNRKSQLQNDLQSLEASISFQEQEQERLAHEYEETRTRIRTLREREDARQQELFYQVREEEARREAMRPESNGLQSAKENMPLPPVTVSVAAPVTAPAVAPAAPAAPAAAPTAAAAAATGGWTSINGAARRRSRREEDDEPPADPGNLLGSVYHNPVDESEVNGHGHGIIRNGSVRPHHPPTAPNGISIVEEDNLHSQARKNGERPLKPKQRHSLPTFTSVVRSPVGKPSE